MHSSGVHGDRSRDGHVKVCHNHGGRGSYNCPFHVRPLHLPVQLSLIYKLSWQSKN